MHANAAIEIMKKSDNRFIIEDIFFQMKTMALDTSVGESFWELDQYSEHLNNHSINVF